MKNLFIHLFFLAFPIGSFAQSLNTTVLSNWNPGGMTYNEVWGMLDNTGQEIAIIGSLSKVHFINIANPASPVLIAEFTPGATSTWRDFKTYGNYVYGVADNGAEGLLIFSVVTDNKVTTVTLVNQITTFFNRAHNIFIDEAAGRLYVAGSDTQNNGIITLNIAANPNSPPQIGSANLGTAGGPAGPGQAYVHDIHVVNNIAYCSHVWNASLFIYNFASASSPVAIGSVVNYPGAGLNHSSWLDGLGNWLVFADESYGSPLKILDVTPPSFNMNVPSNQTFKSDLLGIGTSIAHNPFIMGNYCFVSYYHDGVQIFDISEPTNVVKVAYLDTAPGNADYSGYEGCWGVYPFLPSGNVIASDIHNGLFVFQYSPILPVELASFTATLEKEKVLLNWKTKSESNSDRFEIERSEDGKYFEKIGEQKGAGTTLLSSEYHFADEHPANGNNYYRLKQIDFDGSFEYSSVVQVKWSKNAGFILQPTLIQKNKPFQIHWTEKAPARFSVEIAGLGGQLIYKSALFNSGEKSSEINPGHLDPGIYFVKIQYGAQTQVEKIMITP